LRQHLPALIGRAVGGFRFVIGSTIFSSTQSKYDPSNISTDKRDNAVKPPSVFKSIEEDNRRQQEVLQKQCEQLQQEINALKQQHEQISQQLADVAQEEVAQRASVKKEQDARSAMNQAKQRLALAQENLTKLKQQPVNVDAQKRAITEKLQKAFHDQIRNVELCVKEAEDRQKVVLELEKLQADWQVKQQEVQAKADQLSEPLRNLSDSEKALESGRRQLKTATDKHRSLNARWNDKRKDITDEQMDKMEDLPDDEEELEAHASAKRAEGDRLLANPRAGEEYEQAKKEREEVQDTIQECEEAIATTDASLKEESQAFKEKVQYTMKLLHRRFSCFMRQAGFDGSVVMKEGGEESFEKMGIVISVRYKANAPLLPLSPNQQSGGEKMIATMLFIIALQEEGKSPLRVVDEINQGLDANNERKLMDLLRVIVNPQKERELMQQYDEENDEMDEQQPAGDGNGDGNGGDGRQSQFIIITPQIPHTVSMRGFATHFPYDGSGVATGETLAIESQLPDDAR